MLQKASAMDVRQNLGELLNGVQYRHDTVLITKAGKPIAALIDIAFFEKIRLMRDRFEALSTELAASCQNENPDKIEKEIAEAVKAARKK